MTDVVEVMARAIRYCVDDPPEARIAIIAALTALEAAGYAVVPVVPTEEMKEAHRRAFHALGEIAVNQWSAMLSSAPPV